MKMRLCVLLVVLCGTISNVLGNDFQSGDLYYSTLYSSTGHKTVAVTYQRLNSEENYLGLTSVVIPEKVVYQGTTYSVIWINGAAFRGCSSLTSVTIPNSVTKIGQQAFYGCSSLTSINIPNSVTDVGALAFGNCSSLTSVTLPNGVTSIQPQTFYGCSNLTSVTIPNSVTNIEYMAFARCNSLTSITIPNSVTSIEDMAFAQCNGLQNISFYSSTPPIINNRAFVESNNIKVVYVPCGSTEEYSEAGWSSSLLKEFQYAISVTTTDATMGTARVDRQTTCSDNMAIISATPTQGCYFSQWSDGNTDNPRNLFPTSDTVFTAIFAPYTYTITAVAADHGEVSGAGTYNYGTMVTLTAIPNTGYHFTQWSDGNTDNPRTIVADKDSTFAAEFAIDTYQITVVYDMKKGLVSGGGSYEYGTRVRLEAEPNSGYLFSQWSDGKTYNPYIFTALEDLTLEAVFIPATGIENTQTEDAKSVQKVLRDGQIYILRDGKIYDIIGKEIH